LDEAKVPRRYSAAPIIVIGLIWHLLIGLHIIIVVILTFNSSFVKQLRGTGVIFAAEAAQ
jgi:hypothetical protein